MFCRILRRIHEEVDDGVDDGVGHGEPVEGSGFNFFGSGFGGGLEGIIEHLAATLPAVAEDFNERLQGDEEDWGRNSEKVFGCLI